VAADDLKGVVLPVSCEEDVFRYLGMDYLPPERRNW